MGPPREVGAVQPAMPREIIGRGAENSEEVQLAKNQPHTNDQHITSVIVGDVIPRTGVMRINEEVIPAIRKGD